jgi:hypothetical protein
MSRIFRGWSPVLASNSALVPLHLIASAQDGDAPWLAGAVIDLSSKKGIPPPRCRSVRDIPAIYVDGKPV